jgi:hypothetical protein
MQGIRHWSLFGWQRDGGSGSKANKMPIIFKYNSDQFAKKLLVSNSLSFLFTKKSSGIRRQSCIDDEYVNKIDEMAARSIDRSALMRLFLANSLK